MTVKCALLAFVAFGAVCGQGADSDIFDSMMTPEARRLRKLELIGASVNEDVGSKARMSSVSTLSTSALQVNITNVSQVPGTRGAESVVDVCYDLLGTSNQCEVTATFMTNGVVVPSYNLSEDVGVGVQPGSGKCLRWAVGRDWPDGFSDKFQVRLSATEISIPAAWATVTVAWSDYGGKDIDICAYWMDSPNDCVGFSYSSVGFDTLIWPSKDNTGSGPETVHCDVGGRTNRSLCVHFNYYQIAGNPANVKVTARNNGQSKSLVSPAGVRRGSPASKSDPGVKIVFDDNNNPVSISSL